jgi:pyrophosphatase PpaX
MRFSAVLFDLDGTLVDTVSLILESFRYSLGKLGLEAEDQEILNTIGLPLIDVCFGFAGERGEELFKCYVDYQETIHDRYVKEYAGTTDLFEYLKEKGCHIGIVTSKRKVLAHRGLAVAGLDKFVEAVVALEDTEAHKPEPEPVLKALDILGVPAEKALYVGDSPYDIRCGKNAGAATAGVTWGVSTQEQLFKECPDVIVRDWQELKDFLEG